jgi:thiol-disulfide isomerase/thioredoxin
MSQKIKLVLGISGLILLICAATIAYNTLGKMANRNSENMLARAAGDASDSGENKLKAPDFNITDWDGNNIKFSDITARNKPIVLNFWASWCPPCKIEMPDFDRVYKELGGEIEFVMLDLTDGQRETVETGKRYIQDEGFSFPVFFDTGQEGAYLYGIRSIPTTVFIDKDGYVITGVMGAIDEGTLRAGIDYIR